MWWEEPLDCVMEGVTFILKMIAFTVGAVIPLAVLAGLVWMVWTFLGLVPFPIGA